VALVIAEIGLNHNGDMDLARCLIEEAHAAGADVAKFQFFDASKYFPPDFEWMAACLRARIDYEKAARLRDHCDRVGIEFCVSSFDLEGLGWAERLGVRRHKLASRCIEQRDLVEAMAATGKDMIVSLGMWKDDEFPEIESLGRVDFLYCVAKYPTPLSDLDFERIDFRRYAGFSDHTLGIDAACVAVARGARIVEKHFTLSKKMYGPDHACSAEPHELRALVDVARRYETVLGAQGARP
jgi:sialic acid synthase SpsE